MFDIANIRIGVQQRHPLSVIFVLVLVLPLICSLLAGFDGRVAQVGYNFPLGHLVDGDVVIQPFASILITLMHRVDAQISGGALPLRLASFADGE
jgi:hypothetical protein